jgi:hypothetical protein
MSFSDEGDAEKLETERTIVGVTMEPIIDHIQSTVRDMAVAEPFRQADAYWASAAPETSCSATLA